MKALSLTGQTVGLNVAGIHGTSDISSKRFRVKVGDQDGMVNEATIAYCHPNVNAGNRTNNFKKLKYTYPNYPFSKTLHSTFNVILVQIFTTCIEQPNVEKVKKLSLEPCERS